MANAKLTRKTKPRHGRDFAFATSCPRRTCRDQLARKVEERLLTPILGESDLSPSDDDLDIGADGELVPMPPLDSGYSLSGIIELENLLKSDDNEAQNDHERKT